MSHRNPADADRGSFGGGDGARRVRPTTRRNERAENQPLNQATDDRDTETTAEGCDPTDEQPLPRWVRVVLVVVGILFLLVGLLMLAIPVLPQVWALALAAVCFSLASDDLWHRLERRMRRWPRVHRPTVRLRRRLMHWLMPPTPEAGPGDDAADPPGAPPNGS